ncbi:hypothetical protein JXO59_02745 [candidate division KSB1 bacterium]|nr:hypothetical protein [candidate division KSB1 bacterium]
MQIETVNTGGPLSDFLLFPYTLYRNNPRWIPPLRSEQAKLFDPKKNTLLQHCDYQLFLLRDGKNILGRVAAFIDRHSNQYWHENVGCFGSYESIEDETVSHALLRACETYLRERKVEAMRGPISFETQNWGAVVDDDTTPSRLMSPFNPPYYIQQFESYGLKKIKDLEVFASGTKNYVIPERFLRYKEKLIKKYDLNIRSINMKRLVDDARIIVDLSNRSLAHNWGYAPIGMEEAENLAADLKMIVWPELIKIVESSGKPIGFCITLPDIFQLLHGTSGRLFPLALFRLLFKLRTIRVFRIWALGIVPEFHRRGIDTLLYLSTYDELKKYDALVEANYILEDNYAMKDAVIKLGMQKVRTLRIFQKDV